MVAIEVRTCCSSHGSSVTNGMAIVLPSRRHPSLLSTGFINANGVVGILYSTKSSHSVMCCAIRTTDGTSIDDDSPLCPSPRRFRVVAPHQPHNIIVIIQEKNGIISVLSVGAKEKPIVVCILKAENIDDDNVVASRPPFC